VELVKGNGYFYWDGKAFDVWESVYVKHFAHAPFDWWMKILEANLAKGFEEESGEEWWSRERLIENKIDAELKEIASAMENLAALHNSLQTYQSSNTSEYAGLIKVFAKEILEK
jgi:hypothetical protein